MHSVVDGKQRLVTIFDFVKDRFPVGDKAELSALRGKYFSQLDDQVKVRFWSYQFSVEYLPTSDEKAINSIFDRINRNVAKLTPQELRHPRFDGAFIIQAEKLTAWLDRESPDFPRITQTSRNQMKDVEFVANLLLLLEEGPKGYSVEELDRGLQRPGSVMGGTGNLRGAVPEGKSRNHETTRRAGWWSDQIFPSA